MKAGDKVIPILLQCNHFILILLIQGYHVDCFKCSVCLMKLEPGDYYAVYNDRLYCKDDIEFLLGDNDTSSSANGMCVQVLVTICYHYIIECMWFMYNTKKLLNFSHQIISRNTMCIYR